jgi:hypothetical protein
MWVLFTPVWNNYPQLQRLLELLKLMCKNFVRIPELSISFYKRSTNKVELMDLLALNWLKRLFFGLNLSKLLEFLQVP